MKIIGVLEADLERTPLGTRSRLANALHGQPVLRRTVERVLRARELAELRILVPVEQVESAQSLLMGLRVTVTPRRSGPPSYRPAAIRSRKWSLDGWRGGIGGTSWLDEYVDVAALLTEAESLSADAVWTCPAASPLLDADTIDAMAAFYRQRHDQIRLVFMQAPPGWSGALFQTRLLKDLTERDRGPAWLFSYKPDFPVMDLALKDCCLPTPQPIRHAVGRLIVDTERSWRRVDQFLAASNTETPERLGAWLARESAETVEPFPAEIDLELTTESCLPDSNLWPGRTAAGERGPLPLEVLDRILGGLDPYDDVRLALGGMGDPVKHPKLTDVLSRLARSDLLGIAIHTSGLAWGEPQTTALFEHRVDVVSVGLDAVQPATYERLHGHDGLAEATAFVEKLLSMPATLSANRPLVCVLFRKCKENIQEMEEFVEGWHRRGVWPVVVNPSHFAGQWPDRSLGSMSPPTRTPCRRIMRRAMVLANGRVSACDQDIAGKFPLSSLLDQSLVDGWESHAFRSLRDGHAKGQFDVMPLCATCDEWHRP